MFQFRLSLLQRSTIFYFILSCLLVSFTTTGFTTPCSYGRCYNHNQYVIMETDSLTKFVLATRRAAARKNMDNDGEGDENDKKENLSSESTFFDENLVDPQPIDLEMFQQPSFLGIEPTGNYADPEEVPVFTGVVILLASLFFTFGVFFSDGTQGDAADIIFNSVIQKV